MVNLGKSTFILQVKDPMAQEQLQALSLTAMSWEQFIILQDIAVRLYAWRETGASAYNPVLDAEWTESLMELIGVAARQQVQVGEDSKILFRSALLDIASVVVELMAQLDKEIVSGS